MIIKLPEIKDVEFNVGEDKMMYKYNEITHKYNDKLYGCEVPKNIEFHDQIIDISGISEREKILMSIYATYISKQIEAYISSVGAIK